MNIKVDDYQERIEKVRAAIVMLTDDMSILDFTASVGPVAHKRGLALVDHAAINDMRSLVEHLKQYDRYKFDRLSNILSAASYNGYHL